MLKVTQLCVSVALKKYYLDIEEYFFESKSVSMQRHK